MAVGQPRTQVQPGDIRSIYNGTGGSLAEGLIVKITNTTVPGQVVLAAAATDAFYGVITDGAIADGEWGNCQIRGVALVTALGAVTVGARVTYGAGAKGTTAVAGNAVLGIAMTTGVADQPMEVELSGPGGQEMP